MTTGLFDVAIVGAGPAGSTLAALLARKGLAVALVNREDFPRDKLCGEFLSYDALPILDRLGVDLSACPEILECHVVGRNRTYVFDLPSASRGVSRMLLDDLLFRNAIAAGATAFTGTAATSVSADRVAIGEKVHQARAVVGAWGRWGRFDTQLGRGFVRDHSHRNFGFKRHYVSASIGKDAGSNGSDPPGTIALYSFRRGYLGVNEIENGIVNICGLVHASRLTHHRGRWDAFVDAIRVEQPRLEEMYSRFEPAQETYLSSEPVIFRARSAVEGGVFMIGDASGVIDPLTGNGMAMAIQSALLLAPRILSLVARPDQRETIERDYRESHRAMFGKRIRWSRGVARLLTHPSLLDAALATSRSPRFGAVFVRKTRADRDAIARLTDDWFRSG